MHLLMEVALEKVGSCCIFLLGRILLIFPVKSIAFFNFDLVGGVLHEVLTYLLTYLLTCLLACLLACLRNCVPTQVSK
jgi:hypothetical protein